MKYLKTFEQNINERDQWINDKYWKIYFNSIDELIVVLEKIGITSDDSIYNNILQDYKHIEKENSNHIYIIKACWAKRSYSRTINKIGDHYWYYALKLPRFNHECKFMGEIKAEDWEVKARKYNL